MPRRTIAIANQKGGVGKTTTTVNLAYAFLKEGKSVLAIDLDPQASLSISLGLGPREIKELEDAAKTTYFALVPGSALEGLSLFVQGQNLTNEPFVTDDPRDSRAVIDYQVYGRRYLAGASFKF